MTQTKLRVSDEELEDLIQKYCRDLTALNRAGRYDPISGRDAEMKHMIVTLLQKGRKNVALLAPAGVGKTALVIGLAQYVIRGDVPEYLKDARVLEIDLASMAAGTSGSAEFQGRFIPLCRGIAERYHLPQYPKFVLFIDEMHMIMPMVEGSAYRGLSEVIKPYLTVGDLHVIGATTTDEYRMFCAQDPALDRRFQKLPISVPTGEETLKILQHLRPGFEKHHRLKISDDCLQRVVKLTEEHLKRRNQPDKSIIVMDAAMAYYVMQHGIGGEVDMDSINYVVSKEANLHPDAL